MVRVRGRAGADVEELYYLGNIGAQRSAVVDETLIPDLDELRFVNTPSRSSRCDSESGISLRSRPNMTA